jgi:predicted O-methyltransferase YrrM
MSTGSTIGKRKLQKLGLDNIQLVIGNIDVTFEKTLNEFDEVDFVFIDANHRSEAVLKYFEICLNKVHKNTVLVVDDIYWSADMESAWKQIKEYTQVCATIDLFQLGIVFFNTDLHKKHYKIRY